MENNYHIRKANNKNDLNQIVELLNQVFDPDKVGDLGKTLTNHLPGFSYENWVVAEEKSTNNIVSALCLIPWYWKMSGLKLKVAEMGLVGTHPDHQGKGLMKLINKKFDEILHKENYNLAGIQGIPGFYHKFGYNYAVEMENHLNMDLDDIKPISDSNMQIQKASKENIEYLLKEDSKIQEQYLLSSIRSEKHFEYILNEGRDTEYSTEIFIFEQNNKKAYCRILKQGFGKGLIVTELNGELVFTNLDEILNFLKQETIKREKPFIRFNINQESDLAKDLKKRNAKFGKSYAWQIKIPNKLKFLKKIKPVLQERISKSKFSNFTGNFRLDFYSEQIDIIINNGIVESIQEGSCNELELAYNIPNDLFAALALGHRTWQELQYNRPDLCSMNIIINPEVDPLNDVCSDLIHVLFPKEKSWINLEY